MGMRRKARELSIQTLYALAYTQTGDILQHLEYLNLYADVLSELCVENHIDPDSSIQKFADKLLYHLFPKIDDIDELIKKHIEDTTIDKIGIIELIILRMAIFEMVYDRTPPAVIINEAIELTKKFCAEKSPSLINAVLDKIKDNEVTNHV